MTLFMLRFLLEWLVVIRRIRNEIPGLEFLKGQGVDGEDVTLLSVYNNLVIVTDIAFHEQDTGVCIHLTVPQFNRGNGS
jgi:hypothetical protein